MNLLMNLASSHPHREKHPPPMGHLGVYLPIGRGTPKASLPYTHLEHAMQGSICAARLNGSSLQYLRLIYIADIYSRMAVKEETRTIQIHCSLRRITQCYAVALPAEHD